MEQSQLMQAITPSTISLSMEPFSSKDELFQHMAEKMKSAGRIESENEFIKALNEREDTGSTYMGNMIAIPHGKSSTVKQATIGFCQMRTPMIYASNDEEGPVKIVFMLAVPTITSSNDYLQILATLARLLVYEEFVQKVEEVENYESIIEAFRYYLK